MQRKRAMASFRRTLVYTVVSLFLYIIYSYPPAYVRFVLGAVPIILYAADMSWMTVQMRKIPLPGCIHENENRDHYK